VGTSVVTCLAGALPLQVLTELFRSTFASTSQRLFRLASYHGCPHLPLQTATPSPIDAVVPDPLFFYLISQRSPLTASIVVYIPNSKTPLLACFTTTHAVSSSFARFYFGKPALQTRVLRNHVISDFPPKPHVCPDFYCHTLSPLPLKAICLTVLYSNAHLLVPGRLRLSKNASFGMLRPRL